MPQPKLLTSRALAVTRSQLTSTRAIMLLAAVVLIVGGLMASSVPEAQAGTSGPTAAAHRSEPARHGADFAEVGTRHHTIKWCDREADGHRVYAQYRVEFFGTITTGYDPNGSRPGCGRRTEGMAIYDYRVCEERAGCSGWRRA